MKRQTVPFKYLCKFSRFDRHRLSISSSKSSPQSSKKNFEESLKALTRHTVITTDLCIPHKRVFPILLSFGIMVNLVLKTSKSFDYEVRYTFLFLQSQHDFFLRDRRTWKEFSFLTLLTTMYKISYHIQLRKHGFDQTGMKRHSTS